MSSASPVEEAYSSHLLHARDWSLCIFPVTAPSWAVSAAARSASRQFLWATELFLNDSVPVREQKF
eukprot:8390169-Ditylum_brightwellii.AAC.1